MAVSEPDNKKFAGSMRDIISGEAKRERQVQGHKVALPAASVVKRVSGGQTPGPSTAAQLPIWLRTPLCGTGYSGTGNGHHAPCHVCPVIMPEGGCRQWKTWSP